mmetsp:Transcript_37501/g.90470  ORF Transcript_37501/g.90470 Transcript_37501/m.90470 type:complete len:230 (-) Transcript_37501:309-998(-)
MVSPAVDGVTLFFLEAEAEKPTIGVPVGPCCCCCTLFLELALLAEAAEGVAPAATLGESVAWLPNTLSASLRREDRSDECCEATGDTSNDVSLLSWWDLVSKPPPPAAVDAAILPPVRPDEETLPSAPLMTPCPEGVAPPPIASGDLALPRAAKAEAEVTAENAEEGLRITPAPLSLRLRRKDSLCPCCPCCSWRCRPPCALSTLRKALAVAPTTSSCGGACSICWKGV